MEFIKSIRIIFNGDNYSEWVKEAERRDPSNLTNFMDAKKTLLEENIEMFSRRGSFGKSLSRYEILVENYNKSIKIEALILKW